MRYYQLSCSDTLSKCELCGKKFSKNSRVDVNRELYIVAHPSCMRKLENMKHVTDELYDIAEYEGLYAITKSGKIFSYYYNKFLTPQKGKHGYYCIMLSKNKKVKLIRLHRLVAETFISNQEKKPHINHKNGIKTDNSIDNLEWCTSSENTQHAYDNNLNVAPKGELHYLSKLNEADVLKIRDLSKNNSQRYLAKMFNVSQPAIHAIISGRTWKHV